MIPIDRGRRDALALLERGTHKIHYTRPVAQADLLCAGYTKVPLEGEQVTGFAVIQPRPNLELVAYPDELGGDAEPVALGAQGPLNQIGSSKLTADSRAGARSWNLEIHGSRHLRSDDDRSHYRERSIDADTNHRADNRVGR